MKMIVATDEMGGIGNNGSIPWKCKEDQEFFKFITMGGPIFMGRKTYESLPNPLVGRSNWVISSEVTLRRGFRRANLSLVYDMNDGFIIGGQKLYESSIAKNNIHEMYVSRITGIYECDTFFIVPPDFKIVSKLKLSDNCTVERYFKV